VKGVHAGVCDRMLPWLYVVSKRARGGRAGVQTGVRGLARGGVPAAMLRARSRDSGLAWYISCVGSSWKDVSTVAFKLTECQHSRRSS